MRSVSTHVGRAQRAAEYLDKYSTDLGFWIAIGKTTPWPIDDSPPLASPALSKIPELDGFVYVHYCTLVAPDVTGAIKTDTGIYKAISSSNYYEIAGAKAWRVYLKATLLESAMDLNLNHRCLGLCTSISLNSNVATPSLVEGAFLTADKVSSYFLDWVVTFSPVTRTSDIAIELIREF